ncbi:ABC transporter ATP-binding protein [Fundicoccus culcitae]|uniref:ABC transporter ATP-binding protein/permease n=1 Tax=Fundicoccus culcitae TaxID=2969821 RepID=A0ABY5P691_9LACT|nr:ABC transporter ATP-binding protein [Fundicoccus culcitae]UUX34242.1 ABC transporter ATP-binding protein/permease [Fundicoccus culcitae]
MAENQQTSSPRRAKPRNFWKTIRRLVKYMSSLAWWMLLVIILASVSAVLRAQLPRIMGDITSIIFDGVSQGWQGNGDGYYPIDFEAVTRTVLILASYYVAASIFRYFQQFITARISQHTVYRLRRDIKAKMGRLPISYFDSNSYGDILSRAINDMDQVAGSLGQSLTQLTTSTVSIIAIFFTMLYLSGSLAFIVLLMVPLNIIVIRWAAPKAQNQFNIRQQNLGKLNDFIEEKYSGQTVVKIYNQEKFEAGEFSKRSEELNEASWKAEYYSGLMNPLVGTVKDMIYALIALFGGLGIINGTTDIGVVQSFLQYTNQFSMPFRELANLANTIQMTVAATERVFEVLDEKEMENPSGLPDKEDSPYKVEFEHVQFGYSKDKLLMTDFNLQVKEGEMIAIVGPTGAGKTTLINLLERFYDVSGGAIRYEGRDIRNMSRESLRSKFSMVLQDTWLFNGTIWENLKYGAQANISDEDILKAAKAAHVDDFVRSLPEGYQTMLTEDGTNLSQGQRQLITIARAFLQDPDVLILDEATSSVDTRTEVLIQRAMNRLLEGRTSFVVAHRLSTIRDASNIVVMNHGDVIESGNHDALMEQDGFYAQLYNAQFA